MTEFQKRVYAVISQIPAGKVMSYGEVAKRLGVRSAQAVGQALKVNPNAPMVPCHRVIRSDGYIGGYLGVTEQFGKKGQLLLEEGVKFDEQGYLTDPSYWV